MAYCAIYHGESNSWKLSKGRYGRYSTWCGPAGPLRARNKHCTKTSNLSLILEKMKGTGLLMRRNSFNKTLNYHAATVLRNQLEKPDSVHEMSFQGFTSSLAAMHPSPPHTVSNTSPRQTLLQVSAPSQDPNEKKMNSLSRKGSNQKFRPNRPRRRDNDARHPAVQWRSPIVTLRILEPRIPVKVSMVRGSLGEELVLYFWTGLRFGASGLFVSLAMVAKVAKVRG